MAAPELWSAGRSPTPPPIRNRVTGVPKWLIPPALTVSPPMGAPLFDTCSESSYTVTTTQ